MFNLGFHGSHNATIAISSGEKILEVVELERFLSEKNAALFYWGDPPNLQLILEEIQDYFVRKYGADSYDRLIYNSVDLEKWDPKTVFPVNHVQHMPHHEAHCYSALYQSPYQTAIVISFDGGSDEGFFNLYLASKGHTAKKLYSGVKDYAISYMTPAHFIREIRREPNIYRGNLVYAGKLMGFVGFGKYREDLAERLISFYQSNTYDRIPDAVDRFVDHFSDFGIESWDSYFNEQDGRDIATTNQVVFERLFREEVFAEGFLPEVFQQLPIILTGGCALNIINNTALAKDREVFIPPNPGDSGLALGMLCGHLMPEQPVEATYLGSPVWDRNDLGRHLVERTSRAADLQELAKVILSGGILGVVRGGGEHGPRALGNRSLLCDATNPDMKDLMNLRIKNREPFRPFSPIVRLEDLGTYFDWDQESRWMSFSPPVKPEYADLLSSVVHVDGTARVQTVTHEQNEFVYGLLTALQEESGHGVMLNTSFNVAGKPILNTYQEAFSMLDEKELAGLVLENYYFPKSSERSQAEPGPTHHS